MIRMRLLIGGVLCGLLLICACGESQEPTTPLDGTIGDKALGAPLPRGTSDPGILQDQSAYQGANLPQPSAEPSPGGDLPELSTDPRAEAESLVADLTAFLQDGEVELALRLFAEDDVAPLLADDRFMPLYDGFDTIGRLTRALGRDRANRLLGGLRGLGAQETSIELQDDNRSATVSPNIALVLFGPVRSTDTLRLERGPQDWQFRIEPLSADEASEVIAFHRYLNAALGDILAWVKSDSAFDEARLEEAVATALRGEPIDVPEGAGTGGETP